MKNMKRKGLIIVLILILAGGGWYGFHRYQQSVMAKQTESFNTTTVRRMDLSDKIDLTGNVVMEKNASITPPYNASIKKIFVKPGDKVRQGEVLLMLVVNDSELEDNWSGWKSALKQAQNNLATAGKSLERQEILYKVQGTTIDEVENAESKVRQYQEEIVEYRLKLASLNQNGVKLSSDNQWQIFIQAPFDATVSWINVKLEESITTATEMLTLGGGDLVQIEADVDQSDIYQMKVGLPAFISANDKNRTIIPGNVTSFGSTGTTESSVVTFPVIIKPIRLKSNVSATGETPPNFSGLNQNHCIHKPVNLRKNRPVESNLNNENFTNLLRAGMSVDVTIMVNSHPNVLAIPINAIREIKGQTVAKVLYQGKYVTRKIELGYKNSTYAEVLSGLTEGDEVITQKASAMSQNERTKSNRNNTGGGMMGGPMEPPMGR